MGKYTRAPVTLQRFLESDLLKGPLQGKLVELSLCEREWKQRIRQWLKDFEQENSRPATPRPGPGPKTIPHSLNSSYLGIYITPCITHPPGEDQGENRAAIPEGGWAKPQGPCFVLGTPSGATCPLTAPPMAPPGICL